MAVLRQIMAACGRGATRLFRQNVGKGWVGKSIPIRGRCTIQAEPGDVLVKAARPLIAGLCNGSSDLIGWHTVEITPDMVGQRVALFAALEVKDRAKLTDEQAGFLEAVRRAGGIAAEVRSPEDAEAALRGGVA
jgi:hypothetical protein